MNIRKILTIATLAMVGGAALICVTAVLGLVELDLGSSINTISKLLVTFCVLAAGLGLAINSIGLLERKNRLAFVGIGLISVSALLMLIWAWFGIEGVFTQIAGSFALLSVLVNFIISSIFRLGKKYLWFQIITFAVMFIVISGYIAMIWSNGDLGDNLVTGLVAFTIIAIAFAIAISVMAKNNFNRQSVGADYGEKVRDGNRVYALEREIEDARRENALLREKIDDLNSEIARLKEQLNNK